QTLRRESILSTALPSSQFEDSRWKCCYSLYPRTRRRILVAQFFPEETWAERSRRDFQLGQRASPSQSSSRSLRDYHWRHRLHHRPTGPTTRCIRGPIVTRVTRLPSARAY